MGLPEQVCEEIFHVIEGGSNIGTPAQIIQFTSDNGANTWNVVQKTYNGTNGTAFNYYVAAVFEGIGAARYAASAGAAFLTMEVGTLGAFLAPALGLTTGYVLYNTTPEFWDTVGVALAEAGETVGGKVVAFMNDNGIISFHPNAIEIVKNALCDTGVFDYVVDAPPYADTGTVNIVNYMKGIDALNCIESNFPYGLSYDGTSRADILSYLAMYPNHIAFVRYLVTGGLTAHAGYGFASIWLVDPVESAVLGTLTQGQYIDFLIELDGGSAIVTDAQMYRNGITLFTGTRDQGESTVYRYVSGINATGGYQNPDALQDDATYPKKPVFFPDLYPDWIPIEFPSVGGEQLPDTYPLQYPDILPKTEPYQDPAQNPDPDAENFPEEVVETFEETMNNPDVDYYPDPEQVIDPEIDDTQDPIPDPIEPDPIPDPIEPDPDPTPTPVIPTPQLPDTVSSNKLFTVYNPSQGQLDALGGYLWDSSLMEIIKKIWQNPLDGIISLIQVYTTPTSGSSHNIMLGYLDSGVSAPVVTSQFVTIDCGDVTLKEKNENATDYSPYTTLSIYLPFIGIVELDINECMRGVINVTYRVDVYTGTCLAQVKITRNPDTPNGAIIYTFSGNCSQQIPLTSGDASGLLRGLIATAGAGLSIATGGGFGIVAGASMIGQSLTREMYHVNHSGNLSANAGIMGNKKPYLIINRQRSYTPNTYNKYYGFPINKTVYLNNCTGFTRIKTVKLKTVATKDEYNLIVSLLKDGVIF